MNELELAQLPESHQERQLPERQRQRVTEIAAEIQSLQGPEDLPKIRRIFQELRYIYELSLSQETIQRFKEIYNWLGFIDFDGQPVDIQKEYLAGQIALLSQEQTEAAEKNGYSLNLVIPGQIRRSTFLNKFTNRYAQEFGSSGVVIEPAGGSIHNTESQRQALRPKGLYIARLENVHNVGTSTDLSPNESLQIMNELQAEKPELNLRGLTLEEFLIAEAYQYRTQGRHLGEQTVVYCLEEATRRRRARDIYRVFRANWSDSGKCVRIAESRADRKVTQAGPLFAVVPRIEASK